MMRIDRYTKVILTLIVILLASLLWKPFFIGRPVTAYTTADDAYSHAEEAYSLANKALEKAEGAYERAIRADFLAKSAILAAEEAGQWAQVTGESCRILKDVIRDIRFVSWSNREDLVKIGEKLGITLSSLEDLERQLEEIRK